MTPKVFGIGLSKTGTTSLTSALRVLGYRAEHEGRRFLTEPMDDADAATDELADVYEELDRKFPGAKFILTTRSIEAWLKSCEHHFRTPVDPATPAGAMLTRLYGTTVFDRERFEAGFQRHEAAVREYFRGRPNDLLVLDVAGGQGYDQLCPFLGRPLSGADGFPKENVSRSWDRMWRKLRHVLGLKAN